MAWACPGEKALGRRAALLIEARAAVKSHFLILSWDERAPAARKLKIKAKRQMSTIKTVYWKS